VYSQNCRFVLPAGSTVTTESDVTSLRSVRKKENPEFDPLGVDLLTFFNVVASLLRLLLSTSAVT
jgi:hypothetical protein